MQETTTIKKSTSNEEKLENEILKFFVSYYVSNKVAKKVNRFFYDDFTDKLMQLYGE